MTTAEAWVLGNLGAYVEVTADTAMAAEVTQWVGRPAAAGGSEHARLRIELGDGPEATTDPWLRLGRSTIWRSPGRVELRTGSGAVGVLDLDRCSGTVWAAVDDSAGRWDAIHRCLRPLVYCALGRAGLHVVHAGSAVVDGQVVLVAGPSGAGKSTFALHLAAAGATLLADDASLLGTIPPKRSPTRPVRVVGLGERSRLAPGGPIAVPATAERLADGKFALPNRPSPQSPAPPGLIVFLTDGLSEPGPVPVRPADAMARLLPSWFVTLDPVADRDRLAVLATLVESVPAVLVRARTQLPTLATVRRWLEGPGCSSG